MNAKKFATTVLLSTVAVSGQAWAIAQAPHDDAHGVTCNSCHIKSGALSDPAHLVTGTATAGSTTTLSDGTMGWTAGVWVDAVITFTSGANLGQFRTISANALTSLTWVEPLPNAVAAGDTYSVNKVTYDDIEVKCKSCHNPTGSASSHPTAGLHETGGRPIGCGKCHEPHNVDANSGWSGGGAVDGGTAGANLIRNAIRLPTGLTAPVVYTPGVLTNGSSGNGVCQACHTQTTYYRNDGSRLGHHEAENCTSCHSHDQSFGGQSSEASGSAHLDPLGAAFVYPSAASGACVRCHTDGGFKDYVGSSDGKANYLSGSFLTDGTSFAMGPMTCQTCHNTVADPLGAGLSSVLFVSLKKVNNLDKATALCSQCHQGRESTPSVNSKIAGAVSSANRGLGIVTTSASAAGTTTTLVRSGFTANAYMGYTLLFTNGANHGATVTVTGNDATTITFTPAVASATASGNSATLWPTATGGTGDSYAGLRHGSVIRGIDLVDANRVWTANQWKDYYVFIQTSPVVGDPNVGLYRQITGNTATALTVANATLTSGMPFPAPIAAGTRYQILVKEGDTATLTATVTATSTNTATPTVTNTVTQTSFGISVLDVVASGLSFSNVHYLPASAILHGGDAQVGYQYPKNMANGTSIPTNTMTATFSHVYGTSSTATGTATGTATATNTASATVTVTVTNTVTNTVTSALTGTATQTNYVAGPSIAGPPSYSGKNLHGVSQGSCTSCHNPHNLEIAVNASTCGRCHFKEDGSPVVNMTELEEVRQYGFAGDIDGDGNATESLKAEIDGLAAVLWTAITTYGNTVVDNIAQRPICYDEHANPYFFKDNGLGAGGVAGDGVCQTGEAVSSNAYGASAASWFTPRLLRAAFNYQVYRKEPGAWAHNPRYIIELLYDALVDLNLGLPNNQQVGYYCVLSGVRTPNSSRTCATGTLSFGPRRTFQANTHFDGVARAFRLRDTTVSSAGMVSYPCQRCHGGQAGLEQYLSTATFYDQTQPSAAPTAPSTGMQCTACHTPLPTDTDMKRIRNIPGSAVAGVRVPGHLAGGTLVASVPGASVVLDATNFANPSAMVCSSCHQSRDINGVLLDKYLDGTFSGIDVVGRPFFGTTDITNNGGNIQLSGLPTYIAASAPGTPNNWLYTTSCQAVGKFITISGSANYNGTWAIASCTNGAAVLNRAYAADETGVAWSAFAAATKNVHDIQAGAVIFGNVAHVGYEYPAKTYAGVAMHGTKKADCLGCHQPLKSLHTMKPDEAALNGGCNGLGCHSGINATNYTDISNVARQLTTSNGYDGDATTVTLKTELQSFVRRLGAALNTYAVATVNRGFCVGIDATTDSLAYRAAAAGNTTGVCTTESTNWNTGVYAYDAKMVRAIYNMSMANPGNTGAAWFMGFDYTAQLMYDSIDDLVGAGTAASYGLTRP